MIHKIFSVFRTITVGTSIAALIVLQLLAIGGQAEGKVSEEKHSAEEIREITVTEKTYQQLRLFGNVLALIQNDYVESMDETKLIKGAIKGMLETLKDPHSSYLTANELKDLNAEIHGEFGGIGAIIYRKDAKITIASPLKDTPAERAGLQPGDVIIKIDDLVTKGLSVSEATDNIRGPVKSPVVLTIERNTEKKPFQVRLIRDTIEIDTVDARLETDIVVIRITNFSEKTHDGLIEAINKVMSEENEEAIRGVVLDLRSNPGGLLDQAVKVADTFLDKGEIVSTRGNSIATTQRYSATKGDEIRGKPLVVLLNGYSASAAEIVAGALQDHRRATIIGSRSFGKGSVQTIKKLGVDDGALKLTTSHYYTPSGNSIHRKGITPDFEVLQAPLVREPSPKAPDQSQESQKPQETQEAQETQKTKCLSDRNKEVRKLNKRYVPLEPKDDTVLNFAYDFIRGEADKKPLLSENQ